MAGRRLALILCSLSLVAILGPEAGAAVRTETVRWTDDLNKSGDVTGYKIHYGLDSRSYTGAVDAGIPPISNGVFEAAVEVPAAENVYIAVTAYNEEAESLLSNEICRTPLGESCTDTSSSTDTSTDTSTDSSTDTSTDSSTDTSTDSSTSTDGAQAAIAGFALWDAGSDTVLDSSFGSGEQISLATHGTCVAIEILGNSYLDQGGGSIMKVFDGQTYGGCTDPGLTHENSPPYAWEADQGPETFTCAASLTEAGTHTLTVTPYDGEDCTGAVGTPVTLEFEVVNGEPLSPPGQPQLVAP